ncbi:MAG: YkvA family protein [Thermomicrobiales bacterium]
MFTNWRQQARRLKGLVYALYIAYRDPRTPRAARIVAVCVVGYAFSPIDLIPDPIPIIGYLDDLILIPLGVALAVKLMPAEVWADAQEAAKTALRDGKPTNKVAAAIIIVIWVAFAIGGFLLVRQWL